MVNRFYPPHPALASIVQGHQILHVEIPVGVLLKTNPFPPQSAQNLSFYSRDVIKVHQNNGSVDIYSGCVAVGPQVSRVDLTLGRDFLVVATWFKPGGLHRLLGLPMIELYDTPFDVSLLWGPEVRQIDQQLRETTDYDQMQQIVEAFLLLRLRQNQVEKHSIDAAFEHLTKLPQGMLLDDLAYLTNLSPRQLERKCHERLGYGPKTFSRIVRFSKAFRFKEQRPELSWLDIALACGYYDLQHLRRDFKEFADVSPTLLLQQETSTSVRGYCSHRF
jgi:AraC-like DNA-binding protein